MKNTFCLLLAFCLLYGRGIYAQGKEDETVLEYIAKYKELAMAEMKRTGVPAAIKLAQGIHETGAGTSQLVLKSNNHFGIKCKSNWTGEKVRHTDDAPNECFRKYPSAEDSYKDHSDFLKNSSRYASLFMLQPTDVSGWAYGLKKAGYATNPRYPEIIIRLVEDYHLQDYTYIAMGLKADEGEVLVKGNKIADKNPDVVFIDYKEPAKEDAAKDPDASANSNNQTEEKKEDHPTYPPGEFKINETRVIYVKKGTSFLSIATEYNVPLTRIFEFNDMKTHDFSEKDQLIYIQRKRKTGNNETHKVKPGETLHDIAQSEAIRIESLMEYNYLDPGIQPLPGEVLQLHRKASQPVRTTKR